MFWKSMFVVKTAAIVIVFLITFGLVLADLATPDQSPIMIDDHISAAQVHQESKAVALCQKTTLIVQFLTGESDIRYDLPGECLTLGFSRKGDILWIVTADGTLTTLGLPSGSVLGVLSLPVVSSQKQQ